jgi:hypothetical protein
VLYDGPVEVDWNIGPLGQARRPVASCVLFARGPVPVLVPAPLAAADRLARLDRELTFSWAMAPIAFKYVGRRQTRRAVHQIALLADALAGLWRLVYEASPADPRLPGANRPPQPELVDPLPELGERIDPWASLAVVRALCARAERLHPALRALGVPIPSVMPDAVARLAALAEAALGAGNSSPSGPLSGGGCG